MATIAHTQSPLQSAPPGPPVFYRLTVEEYERIGDKLDEPRVELIDGYLVTTVYSMEAARKELAGSKPQVVFVMQPLLAASAEISYRSLCMA